MRNRLAIQLSQLVISAATLFALTGAPVFAQAPDVVKVAMPQRGTWETSPADLGQVKGIFAKHGIKTETVYTSGGGETMQALISGSVDVAVATGVASIMAVFAKGAPVRPIGNSVIGAREPFWYVPASSQVNSLKDAAGKTIAFSAVGSSSHLAVLTLIKMAGVPIKAQPAGTPQATYTQVMSGQIDIGWGAAPFGMAQLAEKKIRIVARYSDIPEYRDMNARMQVANLNFITGRPQVLRRFLAGYAETLEWMAKGDEPVEVFAKFYGHPVDETRTTRDQFYPAESLVLNKIGGIDQAMADAQALKFISKPFTKAELDELFKYYVK